MGPFWGTPGLICTTSLLPEGALCLPLLSMITEFFYFAALNPQPCVDPNPGGILRSIGSSSVCVWRTDTQADAGSWYSALQ
jgi:hypothetical protein